MKIFHLVLVAALTLACLVSSPGNAKEPDPSVDSVLAKWEEASQKCKTLDAKLTVRKYDLVFGDAEHPISVEKGRFYFEAPNLGRFEINDPRERKPRPWSPHSAVLIWNEKKVLEIDPFAWTCNRLSIVDIADLSKVQNAQPISKKPAKVEMSCVGMILGEILTAYCCRLRHLQRPQEFLPFVVDIHAAAIRQRFQVTVEHGGKVLVLKVVPRSRLEQQCSFREIGVTLDAATYMARSLRVVRANKVDITEYVLDTYKVNERPSDRQQLMNPDLSGLQIFDEL